MGSGANGCAVRIACDRGMNTGLLMEMSGQYLEHEKWYFVSV